MAIVFAYVLYACIFYCKITSYFGQFLIGLFAFLLFTFENYLHILFFARAVLQKALLYLITASFHNLNIIFYRVKYLYFSGA